MANTSFTRDEVILTLDILYSSTRKRASAKAIEMKELSVLLNRLPIHAEEQKRDNFRSPAGISKQVNLFLRCCQKGEKSPHVGSLFFEIAFEYEEKRDELHRIAEAIRRNEHYYKIPFGNSIENRDFPEGGLLEHLHRSLELSGENKIIKENRCAVCGMNPRFIYEYGGEILQLHLVIPPEEMDAKKRYTKDHFITVCPTCHSVLHKSRPWLTYNNCKNIIR